MSKFLQIMLEVCFNLLAGTVADWRSHKLVSDHFSCDCMNETFCFKMYSEWELNSSNIFQNISPDYL